MHVYVCECVCVYVCALCRDAGPSPSLNLRLLTVEVVKATLHPMRMDKFQLQT